MCLCLLVRLLRHTLAIHTKLRKNLETENKKLSKTAVEHIFQQRGRKVASPFYKKKELQSTSQLLCLAGVLRPRPKTRMRPPCPFQFPLLLPQSRTKRSSQQHQQEPLTDEKSGPTAGRKEQPLRERADLQLVRRALPTAGKDSDRTRSRTRTRTKSSSR